MLEPMSEQDIVMASVGVADVTSDHRGRLSYEFDGHGLLKFARAIEAARDAAWQARCDALVAQAVAQEREACAKLCDVTPPYPFRPSIEAAHAIRARPQGGGSHG